MNKKGCICIEGKKKVEWNPACFIEKEGILQMKVDISNRIITFRNVNKVQMW